MTTSHYQVEMAALQEALERATEGHPDQGVAWRSGQEAYLRANPAYDELVYELDEAASDTDRWQAGADRYVNAVADGTEQREAILGAVVVASDDETIRREARDRLTNVRSRGRDLFSILADRRPAGKHSTSPTSRRRFGDLR